MHNPKTNPERCKSIPSLIAFGVVIFSSMPASAQLLHNPFDSSNIDANASDSSGVTSMSFPSSPFSDGGNPNSSSSNNNNGGGGGGSLSSFIGSQGSRNSSGNSSRNTDDNSDSDSNGTETNDINSLVSDDSPINSILKDSEDLLALASAIQGTSNGTDSSGSGSSGGSGSGGDENITATPTSIPEPTSVTALAMIGLAGILAKRNNDHSS